MGEGGGGTRKGCVIEVRKPCVFSDLLWGLTAVHLSLPSFSYAPQDFNRSRNFT